MTETEGRAPKRYAFIDEYHPSPEKADELYALCRVNLIRDELNLPRLNMNEYRKELERQRLIEKEWNVRPKRIRPLAKISPEALKRGYESHP